MVCVCVSVCVYARVLLIYYTTYINIIYMHIYNMYAYVLEREGETDRGRGLAPPLRPPNTGGVDEGGKAVHGCHGQEAGGGGGGGGGQVANCKNSASISVEEVLITRGERFHALGGGAGDAEESSKRRASRAEGGQE